MLDNADEIVAEFRTDIAGRSVSDAVRRHLTFGDCRLLAQEQHFRLKAAVADRFKIHPSEVVVVGSAKLGFSIAPDQQYKPFGEDSDVDVAIVSPVFFDQIWSDVFSYSNRGTEYWPEGAKFKEYLFRGWIRPDKLPRKRTFELSGAWFEFFRELTRTGTYGKYKISAGLYKSWYFLEEYQSICMEACKRGLELRL